MSDNKHSSMKNPYHLTFGEEVGNSVSHGVMMFLLLFGMPWFTLHAWQQGGWLQFIGVSVYILCMIFMFGGSCLYHLMPYDTPWKYVFRKLDHISILLAIAGTYTPIILTFVNNWFGWLILGVEWGLVIAGILLKSITDRALPKLSMTMYMVMGWLAVLLVPVLVKNAGILFISLIVAGGVFYTIGAIFYARKKPYSHFVWHLMIIAASLCHLIAIVWFL